MHEATQFLIALSDGDETALQKLRPLIYEELRRLAKNCIKQESPDPTLHTSNLINEAYRKLIDCESVRETNQSHFFAVAAQLMRHVLIDFARRRPLVKRDGGILQVSLDKAAIIPLTQSTDLIALDAALSALATIDARQSHIVELRFFGGMSIEETAAALNLSPVTVMREWRKAKAWLYRELH
jgi:RNA polymerase sigma factor (TIGR02999 family)